MLLIDAHCPGGAVRARWSDKRASVYVRARVCVWKEGVGVCVCVDV